MNTQINENREIATLAGGCFWCIEAIFRELKGVITVVSGFTGGTTENPTYEDIHSNNTGHAEAIQITFDPSVITYEQLLDIFWHVHNPTTRNRQGADVGREYRSAIFYHDERQKKIAEESKKQLDASGLYDSPAVTEIVPYSTFYPAEKEQQDFYKKNSGSFYCTYVIDPKMAKFRDEYKKLLK